MRALAGPLLGLAGLGACAMPAPDRPLPDALSAVVALEGGGYASVLVDLRGEDGAPAVRATGGVLSVGERGVLSLGVVPTEASGRALRLEDLIGGATAELPIRGDFTLLKLDPDGVGGGLAVVEVDGRVMTLSLADGRATPGGSREAQAAYASGPGAGFHLRRRGEHLELLRPRGDTSRWIPMLDGVSALESATWLRVATLPGAARALVDARLKEVRAVRVEAAEARADGDLSEWRGSVARRVERPSQVLSGLDGWDGPRDASFGVSARQVGDALVLALRVRDDAWVSGGDRLEILLGDRVIRLPLAEQGGALSGPGWQAYLAEAGWQGLALEVAVATPRGADVADTPLVVQLVDVDPGEVDTRLGSAPDPLLAGLAALSEPRPAGGPLAQ